MNSASGVGATGASLPDLTAELLREIDLHPPEQAQRGREPGGIARVAGADDGDAATRQAEDDTILASTPESRGQDDLR